MFFRALAFLVAVCCLTWVGVLWWWQRTGHSAEMADLVLYLGLLPLGIALLLLGLRSVWRRAAARAAAGAATSAVGAAAPAAGGAASPGAEAAEDRARQATVQLVKACVCSVAGEQADLLAAAALGKPLPQPDAALTNDDGLPVLCARIPDKQLALEAVQADLAAVLETLHREPGEVAQQPEEHVLRALAALRPLLESQRDWLWSLHQIHLAQLGDKADSQAHQPPSQRPALPGLRVLLGCPAHWSAAEQALLRVWAEQCLDNEQVPLAKAYTLTVNALPGTGEELWLRADQSSHGSVRSPWLLVAACDSDLSPSRVDALVVARSLYDTNQCPGGSMPGEAAAAVLLAPADWAPPPDLELSPVQLHRPALLRRDKPVDAAGRVAHRELAEALAQSVAVAGVEAGQVGTLVSDADQHSNRGTELYGLAVEALPHLDPVEDMRLLGRVTGRTGCAAPLLMLAAAAEAVQATGKPTLAMALGDPLLRMALVLKPPPAAEPDPA